MLLVNEKLKPFYKTLAVKHTRDKRGEARCAFKGDVGVIPCFLSYVKRKRDL